MSDSAQPKDWRLTGFALLLLAYLTALPVGSVEGRTYQWTLADWDAGHGERVQLQGSVVHKAEAYGMPAGLVVYRSNAFSAVRTRDRVDVEFPMTPELERAVRDRFPDAAGEEGWAMNTGNVFPPPPILALLLLGFTWAWVLGVRSWRWSDERSWKANSSAVALLAIWPWLFLTANGWKLIGARWKPMVELWVPRDLAISGTALLLSLGLVLYLTRPARHDTESASAG